MKDKALGATLVAATALAATVLGLGNALIQDDNSLLVESSRLQGLSHLKEILTSSYWPPPHAPDLYRPLTSLLLALEYGLGGGSPLVFRIGSYLLYALLSVAVFALARRVLTTRIALVAGLVFAVHPVHVEAVALAVGQSELLVGLLSVFAVIRYLDRRRSPEGLRLIDWTLIGVLYGAAALSKEQGLLLPALLLATELVLRAPRSATGHPRLATGEPRFPIAGYAWLGGIGLLALLARRAVLAGSLTGTFVAAALEGLSLPARGLTMLGVVPQWVRLLVWPFHLQADYSPQEIGPASGFGTPQLLGALLLLAWAVSTWTLRRRSPVTSFGLLWTGVALFPVSNVLIPTGIVLAERTMMLPSIGAVLALGGMLGFAAERLPAGSVMPAKASRVALVGLVIALGIRSALRERDWHDDRVLRVRNVEDAPRSWATQLSYASMLFEDGRRDSALVRYSLARELAPGSERWRVRNDLAEHYFAGSEHALAVAELRASLADSPGQELTRHYLVLGLLALGAYREAASEVESALARGGDPAVFGELRVLADSAYRLGVPPGGFVIRVRPIR
jgi:hypothetical protein